MKKPIIIHFSLMIIAALVITGCGVKPTAQETQTTSLSVAGVEDSPTEASPTLATGTGTVKEFTVSAVNWEFDPNTISVNKGDTVRLIITGADDEHSFALKDYNLNINLKPGETKTVEFVADKEGTFQFRCTVPCGEGHREMRGQLIVNA